MASALYQTKPWRELRDRVLAADAECVLAGLAGECRGALVVHHVEPVSEGGPEIPGVEGVVVLCASHHAAVHAWRKRHEPEWKRCPHHHVTPEGRRLCEERLNS